jgi:uncharacterized RDD family membrane protein YckC
MKQAPQEDLPLLLRQRIKRQRKRYKIVRITFALTVVLSIVLMFIANHSQTLAPTSRILFTQPDGDDLWIIDQHLEVGQQPSGRGASFALARLRGDEITTGTRFSGTARGLVRLGPGRLGVTTDSRFLVFDVSGDEWKRTGYEPLGMFDPEASPVVVPFKDEQWICWVRGSDIMVAPFGRPEVEPRSLHKTATRGANLLARATDEAIWLSIIELREGALTLVAFTPGIQNTPPAQDDTEKDADAEPDPVETAPEGLHTAVRRHFSSDVTSKVARASFAVTEGETGPRPVVAVTRKEDSKRAWQMLVWTLDPETSRGKWVDAEAPARDKPPSGLEISNFMTLAARGDGLIALYSEGGEVRAAEATPDAKGLLAWSGPRVIALDTTTGPAAYIVWVSVLFGMLLITASQGVWLLLNRERPMDRTLAEIIEHKEKEEPKEKAKELPKLMYANGLARALSLLLDIAMTSPVIILLQGVYGYTWEQAYGFLAIGTVTSLDADLLPALQATAVTLLVLAIYGTVCEMIWGRTFGKAMFRLRVVNAEGEAPAAWRIVVRNFVKVFELIHWIVLLVPMGLMMMTGKQQRLGDLLAGTYVIVDLVPEESPDDIDI